MLLAENSNSLSLEVSGGTRVGDTGQKKCQNSLSVREVDEFIFIFSQYRLTGRQSALCIQKDLTQPKNTVGYTPNNQTNLKMRTLSSSSKNIN